MKVLRGMALITVLTTGVAGLALDAAPALATPAASLYVVPSGGASSGSYPNACTHAAPCTLDWALNLTDSSTALNGYAVTINLAPGTYADYGNTIESTGGTPYSLELLGEGTGPSTTVLTGSGSARSLYVDGVGYDVTLQDLTLTDGETSGDGANVLAAAASGYYVKLDDDVVSDGFSVFGGQADVISGSLYVQNTTVDAAGDDTYGSLATGASSLIVEDSTYSGNTAPAIVSADAGEASVSYSTIVGNVTGVLDQSPSVRSTVSDSTIAGNQDAGIDSDAASITVSGSILASNNGADCHGTVTDSGNNVLDDHSCGFNTVAGSQVFTTAQIGLLPLASNGGDTQTERITPSSAAHDFLPSISDCEGYDQRGLTQLQPGKTVCDAGAYQIAPPTLTAVSPTNTEPGATGTIYLTGQNLNYATASFGSANVPATVNVASPTNLTLADPSSAQLALGPEPITVSNADGTATIAFTATGPVIGTLPGQAPVVGESYSQTFPVSNYGPPAAFTVSAGALPAGLTLSGTGTVYGVPTTTGTSSFTIKLTDAFGVTVTSPEVLTVVAPRIGLELPRATLNPGGAELLLACGVAACSGTGKLTIIERFRVKHDGKIRTRKVTSTLAKGSYSVTADGTGPGILGLTRAGVIERTLLRRNHKSVTATINLELTGGASLTTKIRLSAKAPTRSKSS